MILALRLSKYYDLYIEERTELSLHVSGADAEYSKVFYAFAAERECNQHELSMGHNDGGVAICKRLICNQ